MEKLFSTPEMKRRLEEKAMEVRLTKPTSLVDAEIIPNSTIVKAAAHVEDGLEGREAHGKARFLNEGFLLKTSFAIQTNALFTSFCVCCMFVILGGSHFEFGNESHPPWLYFFISTFSLGIVALDCALKAFYMGLRDYLKKEWQLAYAVCILLLFVDHVFCVFGLEYLRILRVLRPALIVCRSREVRRVYTSAKDMIPKLLDMFSTLLFTIACFVAVGMILFERKEFSSPVSAMLNLFALLSEDGITEAMSISLLSSLYYVLFLVINLFVILPNFFGVVVREFITSSKEQVIKDLRKQRNSFSKAYTMLYNKNANGAAEGIGRTVFKSLFLKNQKFLKSSKHG